MKTKLADSLDLQDQLDAAHQRIAEIEALLRSRARNETPATIDPLLLDTFDNIRTLINSTDDCIWVVDRKKRMVLANEATQKSFLENFAVEIQPGMSSEELLPAEYAEYFDQIYAKALRGQHLKLDHRDPEGNVYASTIQPVKKAGEIIGVSVFARDTTEQHQLQLELSRFEQIISSTPDMVSLVDRDYRYCIVNDAYLKNFKLQREQIIGKTIADLVGEEHFQKVSAPCLKKAFAGENSCVEDWMEVPGLGRRFLAVTYHPLQSRELSPRYVAIDARDLTELKRAEEDRQRVFDVSLDMLCVADFSGRFKELNPAWARTLGWASEEMKNKSWQDFVAPEDQEVTEETCKRLINGKQIVGFENRYLCKDGSQKWLSWNCFPDLERQRIFAAARDVTARKQLEAELRQLATTDPLTGACNRRRFIELAAAELKRSRRYGAQLAMLMLDIDHFKQVNDNYGHDAGDEVLVRLVDCCLEELRETDIFGRFGGEEFAAVLVQSDQEAARQTCDRLSRQLANLKIRTRQGDIRITVSIGLTMLSADDFSIDPLLKRADDALYRAKNQGRNQVVHF